MTTYQVEVTREGRWWMISVPSIDALTQARHVAEVPLMARELVAVHEGKKLEDVEVEIGYRDINGVQGGRVEDLQIDRETAEALTRNVATRTAQLARDLVGAEVSLRDIAELIGVSHQRVHQLVKASQPAEPVAEAAVQEADVVELVEALRRSVEDAKARRQAARGDQFDRSA